MSNPKKKDPAEKYNNFVVAFLESHPLLDNVTARKEATKLYHEIKNDNNAFNAKMAEFSAKKQKRKVTMLHFLTKPPVPPKTTTEQVSDDAPGSSKDPDIEVLAASDASQLMEEETVQLEEEIGQLEEETGQFEEDAEVPKREAHAQQKCEQEISKLQSQQNVLLNLRISGLQFSVEQRKQLKSIEGELKQKQTYLKKLKYNQVQSRKRRGEQKQFTTEIRSHGDVEVREKASKLFRAEPGRPPVEESFPELQKTILDLVMPEGAADQKRRAEIVRTCKTVTDSSEALKKNGVQISRTSTYYRLLPHRADTIEGRRHNPARTVPVKLVKAQASAHKEHKDGHFASATIKWLKEIAGFFGSKTVFFLSQDDKARVPLGLPAANKQSPILMHVEYTVSLPDHDWVVATGHKMIPSVYGACIIDKQEVTYSGPTYIAIRSGKHDSSTAATHSMDFEKLIDLEEFEQIAKTELGLVKPIVVITVDGGPDENPRFEKTRTAAIKHFRKYNLDVLFIATHAPGQSAYNVVERRMAPLSHDLAGLILPHDHYGSHDAQGNTVDVILEKQNFTKAGDTLAEVWSTTIIDGHPVVAEYIDPESPKTNLTHNESHEWIASHVRQSQYFIQIVRCNNDQCCTPWRSVYGKIISDRFIPAPVLFKQTNKGIEMTDITEKFGKFGSVFQRIQCSALVQQSQLRDTDLPFDYHCPSVQEKLDERTCTKCGIYFSTMKTLNQHKILHKKRALVIAPSPESDPISDSEPDINNEELQMGNQPIHIYDQGELQERNIFDVFN